MNLVGAVKPQRTQRTQKETSDSESECIHLTGGNSFLLEFPSLRSLRSLRFANCGFQLEQRRRQTRRWGGPTFNPASYRVSASCSRPELCGSMSSRTWRISGTDERRRFASTARLFVFPTSCGWRTAQSLWVLDTSGVDKLHAKRCNPSAARTRRRRSGTLPNRP